VNVALVGVAVGNRVLAVREGECKDGDGGVVDDEDAVALLQVRDCIRRETAFGERLHSVRDCIRRETAFGERLHSVRDCMRDCIR
jgi:hypothetical protein